MVDNFVDRVLQYYHEYEISEGDIDLNKLKEYQELFNTIDPISQCFFLVKDYHRNNCLFISERMKSMLNIHSCSTEALLQNFQIHPDDRMIIDSLNQARKYICKQRKEERKNYKLVNNFRICSEANQCFRIDVQHSVLEMDKQGNIWLGLRVIHLDPDQESNRPASSFLQHVYRNEIIYSIYGDTESGSISRREREVLELISEGYVSKEIAEKLFISEYTVNNHRKSILKKLNANNASEAIKKAVKLGIIR
ncbi:helix-turn-helix domain-containing protein [Marinifilum flexuosum]|uniref:helix-turn-helix domain-containing protein n=1 Tax=Marinifilum flexuosum TaxID=1117708 RepID=UPI00249417FD|nr:response regulator transcription factor [Marinifilum flexuosum]